MFAVQAGGTEITTIEGLTRGVHLSEIQAAFVEHHALQCGFCTPGFILAAHALLQETAGTRLERSAIRNAISGNLCRCTGYQNIVDAIESMSARRAPGHPS
jgi:aerobic-type carbon monoxide dehydrogenase small subunit (CoxS/CutS family)